MQGLGEEVCIVSPFPGKAQGGDAHLEGEARRFVHGCCPTSLVMILHKLVSPARDSQAPRSPSSMSSSENGVQEMPPILGCVCGQHGTGLSPRFSSHSVKCEENMGSWVRNVEPSPHSQAPLMHSDPAGGPLPPLTRSGCVMKTQHSTDTVSRCSQCTH